MNEFVDVLRAPRAGAPGVRGVAMHFRAGSARRAPHRCAGPSYCERSRRVVDTSASHLRRVGRAAGLSPPGPAPRAPLAPWWERMWGSQSLSQPVRQIRNIGSRKPPAKDRGPSGARGTEPHPGDASPRPKCENNYRGPTASIFSRVGYFSRTPRSPTTRWRGPFWKLVAASNARNCLGFLFKFNCVIFIVIKIT